MFQRIVEYICAKSWIKGIKLDKLYLMSRVTTRIKICCGFTPLLKGRPECFLDSPKFGDFSADSAMVKILSRSVR